MKLRSTHGDMGTQLEAYKEESISLHKRLKEAEEKMFSHTENTKTVIEKLIDEISILKSVNNDNMISYLKSKNSEAA